MEEQSDHPEPKDRGQKHPSGIQQKIGRGRSPVRPGSRSPRSKPTESKGAKPTTTQAGASTGTERDPLGSLSGTTLHTTVPSIRPKSRDVMGDPSSDTDNDTTSTDHEDWDSEDSELYRNRKRGNRRHDSDSAKRKEDDNTQYDEFQRMQPFTKQASFPVSENSIECDIFNRSLQDLVACLRRSNTGWISIDCLGRRWVSESKESKIRTTVVIGFSQYPDRAQELKRDLQMAMKDDGLPVEFIQGRVTEYVTNPFGAREPENPLVCGASCAPHGISKAGTVGGFITIHGDPDPGTVYAVTNHHVVAESADDKKEIIWAREEDMESHLGLTEQQAEDLADLRLDRHDRRGIHRILTWLGYLKPTPRRTYGDDRQRYLRDFLEQALSYWNRRHPRNPIAPEATLVASLQFKFENFNLPGQRTEHRRTYWVAIHTHGLEDFEKNIMEDMRCFLNLHYYVLQVALGAISTLTELNQGDRIALFKDVILLRRLWREPPKMSRIIEHPANEDLNSIIGSVKDLLSVPGGEAAMPQGDTELLRQKLQGLENHMRSANKLIGTVWASSGIRYYEWAQGSPLRLKEDWALIRLFRNNGQEFQNTLSANPLRPGYPKESFTGVRDLSSPTRMDVTKRGRTTDLTAGVVNGAQSVINLDRGVASAFVIVSKPHITQFFSAKGDSGSWIMDRIGQLVGMMWGGRNVVYPANKKKEKEVIWDDLAGYTSQHLEVEDVTYFTPASYLFRQIESSFKKGMRALGHDLPDDFEGRVRLFE